MTDITTIGASAEWSRVESSVESIAPPSSDDALFDAEILGDELMDIYNAAVVGGGDDDEGLNDIPSLLGPTENTDGGNKNGDVDDCFVNNLYNNTNTKANSSSPDSKLITKAGGANTTSTVTASTSDVLFPVVSSTSLSPDQIRLDSETIPDSSTVKCSNNSTNKNDPAPPGAGTKRKSESNGNIVASASKRRVPTGRKISTVPSKLATSNNKKSQKKKQGNNNTPNPLETTSSSSKNCGGKGITVAAVTTSAKSTVTKHIMATKAPIVPIKLESVNQLAPSSSTAVPLKLESVIKSSASMIPVVKNIAQEKINVSSIPLTLKSAPVPVNLKKNVIVAAKAKAKPLISSVAPVSILSNPPTEADFKSVAQAAVNNLIMNVGNGSKPIILKASDNKPKQESSSVLTPPSSSSLSSSSSSISTTMVKRVDTSTEHVKALTGSNWVAVCGGGISSINNAVSVIGGDNNKNGTNNLSSNDKNCNRARRSNLTPDERARQNRDRNREHARNTRLRKKAYVEELKATLSALVAQRDATDVERRHASQRELEQREVRFRVLEEFLKLRGRNEPNPARWSAILEDKFHLTLPITDFRDMVHRNREDYNKSHEQVVTGVPDLMEDSSLCSVFLQKLLGKGATEIVTLSYNCDRNDFFMDNCKATLDWTATTGQRLPLDGGVSTVFVLKGQIQAMFCPASNKLISAVVRFDTGAIASQINRIVKGNAESIQVNSAENAARVAANEADALLSSLQMPHFDPPNNPGTINHVPPSSVSSANSDSNSDDDKDEMF